MPEGLYALHDAPGAGPVHAALLARQYGSTGQLRPTFCIFQLRGLDH